MHAGNFIFCWKIACIKYQVTHKLLIIIPVIEYFLEFCNILNHCFISERYFHLCRYYPITRREVVLPPPIICIEDGMQITHWTRLKDEVRFLTTKYVEKTQKIFLCFYFLRFFCRMC